MLSAGGFTANTVMATSTTNNERNNRIMIHENDRACYSNLPVRSLQSAKRPANINTNKENGTKWDWGNVTNVLVAAQETVQQRRFSRDRCHPILHPSKAEMSLIGRSMLRTAAGKRFFSAVVSNPKVAIAQNVMLMKEIANAADEATLNRIASSGLPAVNTANPPKELEDFSSYFSLSELKSSEKFVRDPHAWQNKSGFDYVGTELQRAETWPFMAGFL
jgi:hypothetical protein